MSRRKPVSRASTTSVRLTVFGQVSRPPDYGRMVGQVDQRARTVGGDHLALADLSVGSETHGQESESDAVSGLM